MDVKIRKIKRAAVRATITIYCAQSEDLQKIVPFPLKKGTILRDILLINQKKLNDLNDYILNFLEEEVMDLEMKTTNEYEKLITTNVCSLNNEINMHYCTQRYDGQILSKHSFPTVIPEEEPSFYEIHSFGGDPSKWKEFWNSFESIIHFRVSFTEVIKFNYLLNVLKDEAKKIVEKISVTNANYVDAVNIMKERFAKKEEIISKNEILSLIPEATEITKCLKDTNQISFENYERSRTSTICSIQDSKLKPLDKLIPSTRISDINMIKKPELNEEYLSIIDTQNVEENWKSALQTIRLIEHYDLLECQSIQSSYCKDSNQRSYLLCETTVTILSDNSKNLLLHDKFNQNRIQRNVIEKINDCKKHEKGVT